MFLKWEHITAIFLRGHWHSNFEQYTLVLPGGKVIQECVWEWENLYLDQNQTVSWKKSKEQLAAGWPYFKQILPRWWRCLAWWIVSLRPTWQGLQRLKNREAVYDRSRREMAFLLPRKKILLRLTWGERRRMKKEERGREFPCLSRGTKIPIKMP